jgi:hypothetical protein
LSIEIKRSGISGAIKTDQNEEADYSLSDDSKFERAGLL